MNRLSRMNKSSSKSERYDAMKVFVQFDLDESWDREYKDCSDEVIFADLDADGFISGVKSATLVKVER